MFWMSNFPNRRGYLSFTSFLAQVLTKVWIFTITMFLPMYVHGFMRAFLMWHFYHMVFSVGYALFFAVNHWTLDAGFVDNSSIRLTSWGVLQVENSLNFGLDSTLWTNLSGGLNYQIEHHLFPGMMHTRLPEITEIVQATCKEFKLRYFTYPSFWGALVGHYHLLKTLGQHDRPPSPKEGKQ
jgi:fatty acid desaturase